LFGKAETLESDLFVEQTGDACNLPSFADNSFDIAHSNSVIEHVGDWERVEAFAKETRRLAPVYHVQTPYYWFPVEPHFLIPIIHWLPEGFRAKIFLHISFVPRGLSPNMGAAMRRVESAYLLDRAQMAYLFPDAQIRFEWFGPFAKSLIASRTSGSAVRSS
jgi:hypothetical protein